MIIFGTVFGEVFEPVDSPNGSEDWRLVPNWAIAFRHWYVTKCRIIVFFICYKSIFTILLTGMMRSFGGICKILDMKIVHVIV